MPLYTIRWTNRSNVAQDWIIHHPADQFTLQPNHSRPAQVNMTANWTFRIAVTSPNGFAAADLTYTAATATWQIASPTPNEFVLAVNGANVRVTCLLALAAELDTSDEPQYEADEPALEAEQEKAR